MNLGNVAAITEKSLAEGDADTIERATLDAVAPEDVEEFKGWLLPFDTGTIGRAKSAVPLWRADITANTVRCIADRYRERGLSAAYRLADHRQFDSLREQLRSWGYRPSRAAWVQVAQVRHLALFNQNLKAELASTPNAAWGAMYLGAGFDPIDGTSRVKNLSRAIGSLYASLLENGQTLAVGAAAFSQGWVSVHGMRTDAMHRGRGLAGCILSTVAAAAVDRGLERCFLQVEEDNLSAQSLYRRTGFETVWRYAYWTQG